MKPVNKLERRKQILNFSFILVATLGIAVVIVAMILPSETRDPELKLAVPKTAVASRESYNAVIIGNKLLAAQFASLQSLDENYARLLTESNDKNKMDSINSQINAREILFRKSLDSIFLNMPQYADSGYNNIFDNIISSYKAILQNRSSITSLRNVINMGKKNITTSEMAMLATQKEIQEKSIRIASLESALKAAELKKASIVVPTPEMSNENTALKKNIVDQQNRIGTLTTALNNLKQDNDKLLKQSTDVSKTSNASELFYKNKSAGLQQKVDALNAELSLSLVDCNLSRVDAGQIISTSRQRKQLLSEASGILSGLAKSDDMAVKKKVQEKITRLNQVVANSRD